MIDRQLERNPMSDQTAAGLASRANAPSDFPSARRAPAAARLAASLRPKSRRLARSGRNEKTRSSGNQHNALEPTRPLIFCDPENGWNEIITPDRLCEGALARDLGNAPAQGDLLGSADARRPGDEPVFDVAHVYTESDWGMHETKIGGEEGGSYVWERRSELRRDLPRLRFPTIRSTPPTERTCWRWRTRPWATC